MTDYHFDKVLLLIDGHALIYRAYHAFPELTTSQGVLVNAVYGFTRILLTSLRDFEPDYWGVAFDHPKKTFRHEEYQDYKATRAEMPDDLKPQIEIIKGVVKALNVPQFEVPGFEADDLIGTVSLQAKAEEGLETVIVTGDKDVLQLVDDQVTVFIPGRGKFSHDVEYEPETVKQKLGISPAQVIELKALMGDASDNIPGVKGIGQKTAVKILESYPTIDLLYQRIDHLQATGESDPLLKGAVLSKLIEGRDSAHMSRQLATINRESPITLDLEGCKVSGYSKQAVTDVFEELGFMSLVPLLPADDFELGVQEALW